MHSGARWRDAVGRMVRIVASAFLAAGLILVAASYPATAQGPGSKWTSFRPRAGIQPLMAPSGFIPGRYMIYVGNADPIGMTVSEWQTNGPLVLQAGDRWLASLMPNSGLRLEREPAALLNYAKPSGGFAQIYAASEDPTSWQAVCVLPVGVTPRPNCFGGSRNITDVGKPGTFSRWDAFTPDPRQFAGQPGGVWPLRVIGYPNFVAGHYMIFVANAGPHGREIATWNTFGPVHLIGGDRWQATLRPQAQLMMERNPATLINYTKPDQHHAMIYVRNDDRSVWQAICVLPQGQGMAVQTHCFGGSNKISYVPGTKQPGPGETLEGAFAGRISLRYVWPSGAQGADATSQDGRIEFTVRDGSVSGSLTVTRKTTTVTARFGGRLDGTSGFTGTLEGASVYKPETDRISSIIVKALLAFPFRGRISGRFERGAWTGRYEAQSTDQRERPVGISGNWTAEHTR